MSTTYYQLFNGKRRLITLILIAVTLILFVLPFFEVVYNGQSVAKVSGLEMLFGKRGYTLIKEMGLDMGISRKTLAGMAVNFGYVVLPLISAIIPVAAMILAISFIRSSKRASAIMCAIMMLVSFLFFYGSMSKHEGQAIITLRVAKRYVQESADKGKQFVLNQTPVLEAAISPEEKQALLNQTLDEAGMSLDEKVKLLEQINNIANMKDLPEEEIKPMYNEMTATIEGLGMSDELKAKLDDQMGIVPMTQEAKDKLREDIDKMQEQTDLMTSYNAFLSGKVYGWEHISTDTQVQNESKQKEAAELEAAQNVLLHLEGSKLLGINTKYILLGLMALALVSACLSAVGKYKMAK